MPFNRNEHRSQSRDTFEKFSRIIGLMRFVAGFLLVMMFNDLTRAFISLPVNHYDLTLEWDPSPSPEVVGNHLYYGTISGQYTDEILIGNVSSVTVSGLSYGVTYYFAVTAIGENGKESDFSNEFSYVRNLAGTKVQIQTMDDG